tara:strand:- start:42 stop:257 length:216 start_codon:yes stop_codon:yes gene_type:complete
MKQNEFEIVQELSFKVLQICKNSHNEIEKNCWIVIHEYCNGFLPSEYDIREIDEELYLQVLDNVKLLLNKL